VVPFRAGFRSTMQRPGTVFAIKAWNSNLSAMVGTVRIQPSIS
jgi:hypothetical protein